MFDWIFFDRGDVTAANAGGIKAMWFSSGNHAARSGAKFSILRESTELPQRLEEWGFFAFGRT